LSRKCSIDTTILLADVKTFAYFLLKMERPERLDMQHGGHQTTAIGTVLALLTTGY